MPPAMRSTLTKWISPAIAGDVAGESGFAGPVGAGDHDAAWISAFASHNRSVAHKMPRSAKLTVSPPAMMM